MDRTNPTTRPTPALPAKRALFARRSAVSIALLACFATASVACEEAPPPKDPSMTIDAAEQKKIDEGRKKIDAANRAYAAQKYDDARKLLNEALALNVESQRFEIGEVMDKVDKRFAKLWANDVSDQIAGLECGAAIQALAKPIAEIGSEVFTRELRGEVTNDLVRCVNAVVKQKAKTGELAAARAIVNAPETEAVLGDATKKKLSADLDKIVIATLKELIEPALSAKKWGDAADLLAEALKKGDASEAHIRVAREGIRQGVRPEILALAEGGLGSSRAARMLEDIDKLMKVASWELMGEAVAELATQKALPEDLLKARTTLATWVEAQRVRIKLLKRAEKRWTHGKVPVSPAGQSDGASKRDIEAATEVWVIGQTRDKALIALEEPSAPTLPALLSVTVGWVPVAKLATTSTIDWLLPDDQLQGVRVWGPLRLPDTTLELGFVTEVKGKDVSVKRITDDQVVDVPKSSLRNGRLAPNTKVLAFCTAKGEPATIVAVETDGRTVQLKCDEGGATKSEILASLRTKAELLPPAK